MEKPFANESIRQTLQIGYNASGAAAAALKGDVVVIVDVIDMSTTAEAVLDAGAVAVYGAAPDAARPPVRVNPEEIGYLAGLHACKEHTEVVIVAEPRWGTEEERRAKVELTLTGIKRSGAKVTYILPNIGGEISRLAEFDGRVVLIVSDTGGVAFDAAVQHGAPEVLTATIARTQTKKGLAPIHAAVKRAVEAAREHQCGISLIAASASSHEDVLAVEALARKVIESGFLDH